MAMNLLRKQKLHVDCVFRQYIKETSPNVKALANVGGVK